MFPYPINDLLHELQEAITPEIANGTLTLKELQDTLERKVIIGVLRLTSGNKSRASRYLGMSRVKLDYMLKLYQDHIDALDAQASKDI